MKQGLLLLALLSACRHSTDTSEIKWAHAPADQAISTINARLNYLDLGFNADFSDFQVCIQGSPTLEGSDLLLETKIAYAAWLNASGQGSENVWQRFQFMQREQCTMTDTTFNSVVVISTEEKITPDQEIGKKFLPAKVDCLRQGNSVNCSSGKLTMGWGGPGSIGYSYFKPEKWESISNRSPATVLLSPYVQWESLGTFLESLEESALRERLSSLYSDLSQRGETVAYEELVRFHEQLRSAQLKARSDVEFARLMDEFLNSEAPSLSQHYTPRLSAFHVLLHEVGHQFGMNHADNPAADSETGFVGDAEQRDGQWVTKTSTMAYADQYFYLTADDEAGIRNLATKVLSLVKSHR